MSNKSNTKNKLDSDLSQQASKSKKVFKTSLFTIRFKLVLIITSLLIGSLGAMAYLTSRYFSEETSIRIQEFNLNIARSIGRQMETELRSVKDKARFISFLGLGGKQQGYAQNIFRNNPNFIFLSVGSVTEEGDFNPVYSLYNGKYMELNKLTQDALQGNKENSKQYFLKAKQNIFSIYNASIGQIPLLGLSFLLDSGMVLVLYIYPEIIFKSFESRGIVTSYMVDELGDVAAHANSEVYLKRLNLNNNPIVRQMLESPVSSGQLSYRDQDGKNYLASFQKIAVANLGIVSYVEEEVVFSPVRKLQERNLLILAIILLSALFIAYYFAKTLSVPLLTLLRAMKEVEQGHYDLEIKAAFKDEVGSLTNSFLDMTQGLKERAMAKDALGRFVNKQIAEQAMQGKIKLGGEKKYAAVSFIDMRNFTSMAEKMRAEDVVSFLNEYLSSIVKCVIESGGTVDKYIGDAVMSHWGALGEIENETEAAILAALNVRKTIQLFNQNLTSQGQRNPVVRVGCGIHSGEVISGQIGSDERLEYTIIGDTVNVASRLEALNKPLGTDILISHESHMRVQGRFKVEIMPPIRVKGKSKPQIIYAVLGEYTASDTPENLNVLRERLKIPFNAAILQQPSMQATASSR